jgi:hypothetical protein
MVVDGVVTTPFGGSIELADLTALSEQHPHAGSNEHREEEAGRNGANQIGKPVTQRALEDDHATAEEHDDEYVDPLARHLNR